VIHDYDNYLPSQTERFSDGFIHVELFWEDCSEQLDFPGFTNSEAFEYGGKKINEFHKVATKEKENVDPARQTRQRGEKPIRQGMKLYSIPSLWQRAFHESVSCKKLQKSFKPDLQRKFYFLQGFQRCHFIR